MKIDQLPLDKPVKAGVAIFTNLALMLVVIVVIRGLFSLDALLPFNLPGSLVAPGWVLAVAGILLMVWSESVLLSATGKSGAPAAPTQTLIERGPYNWTRNPIYLGGFFVLTGLAFMRQSPFLLIGVLLYIPAIHLYILKVEEPHASRRFGLNYQQYIRRVPRWIPRLRSKVGKPYHQ